MGFNAYGAGQSENSTSNINWEELNNYVVETADLKQRETLVGYVSVIADLGTQELEDAEIVFVGSKEDEEKAIEDNPETYFKDGLDNHTRKPVRLKCWPQKPQQCVAVAIDLVDIIIDKGKFFGESKPLPLRIWMGGQFFTDTHGMTVGRKTPLKVVNLDKTRKTKKWSLSQNHLFHKMAKDSKLISPDDPFMPQRIDELLGKAFQFEVQVFFKKAANGKSYYTEYIKYIGALGRGQSEPELLTEPVLIGFEDDNSDEALTNLRSHVINTMKMATNWEGSKIKVQLESRGNSGSRGNASQDDYEEPDEYEGTDNHDDDDAPF